MELNLSCRTQLALLSNLRQSKNPLQKGFTLVELMIVVAVIGILSAVALPQFLNARNAADSGARIGSGLGLAKECAVLAASDIGSAPASATNIAVGCTSSGGTVTVTLASGASGLRCLSSTSVASNNLATISITGNGTTTCAFSP